MLDGDQCEVCGSDGINHGAGSNCPVDNCPKCEESDNQFSN